MVSQRFSAHFAMILILLLLSLALCFLLPDFHFQVPEHPAPRITAAILALVIAVMVPARIFSPRPPRQLRDALENGSTLRIAEAIRLAESLAVPSATGSIALLTDSGVNADRDPVFRALRRSLPSSWDVQAYKLPLNSSPTGDSGENPASSQLPNLSWTQFDWVVVSDRHREILRELQAVSSAGKLRKAVLFAHDSREARHWVDAGLADAAVYYEVAPDHHRTLRAGGALSPEEAFGLFHLYPLPPSPDRR